MPKVEAWMAKKAQQGKTNCTLENAGFGEETSLWEDRSETEDTEIIGKLSLLQVEENGCL